MCRLCVCVDSTHHHDDLERHAVVEAAVLHRYGHDQPAQEHVVGGVQVVDGNLRRYVDIEI